MPTLGILLDQTIKIQLLALDGYKDYFDLLLHPDLHAQITMLMLRLSAIPQLGYFARVIPPRLFMPHAERFDQMVMDTARRKFALPNPLTDAAKISLHLPIKLGGLGLRKVVSISLPAFFCAASNAAPDILSSLDEKSVDTLLLPRPQSSENNLPIHRYGRIS